jgi:hypothetical protein
VNQCVTKERSDAAIALLWGRNKIISGPHKFPIHGVDRIIRPLPNIVEDRIIRGEGEGQIIRGIKGGAFFLVRIDLTGTKTFSLLRRS